MTDEEIITRARELYCQRSDNNIEIDDTPKLSHGDDGVWVQAWVWVPDPSQADN